MEIKDIFTAIIISRNTYKRYVIQASVMLYQHIQISFISNVSPEEILSKRLSGTGILYIYMVLKPMMTSSNGNIFRVTGPLCGEFTGHRWIPRIKASDAELCSFLSSVPE